MSSRVLAAVLAAAVAGALWGILDAMRTCRARGGVAVRGLWWVECAAAPSVRPAVPAGALSVHPFRDYGP
jgi:hypothetical protein